jgi:hypothetical protein
VTFICDTRPGIGMIAGAETDKTTKENHRTSGEMKSTT